MTFRAVFLMASALAITSLYAGPTPITPSQLGYNSNVTFGPSGQPEYLICPTDVSGGCGGAFTENIGGTIPGINGINATIWCVDSQESVTMGLTYSAYIEDLNNANGLFDANHVHYDGITSTGAGGWLYSLSGYGVSNPDSALTRFKLAAILISQYVPNSGMPTNSAENQSIQDAIWHLTENNTVADVPNLTNAINDGTPAGYADWIAYAAHILNTPGAFDFSQWAIVSGGWKPGTNFAGETAYQTFLVQVTPEPRFLGLLLVGLLSIFGVVYRRLALR
jgi:hypothetical protein